MWEEIVSHLPDAATLGRLLFASNSIPAGTAGTPKYIELITNFAFKSSDKKPSHECVRVLLENLHFLNDKAFATDKELLSELVTSGNTKERPLNIILISNSSTCKLCKSKLVIRADRPASVTLYTEDMGTIPGNLYRKYCSNSHKGCPFTQHYGYYCLGDSKFIADSNWDELPYLISTSKTGFSISLLQKFDAELLLGQISYKQKSEIYNYFNKYEQVKKTQSTISYDSDDENEDHNM